MRVFGGEPPKVGQAGLGLTDVPLVALVRKEPGRPIVLAEKGYLHVFANRGNRLGELVTKEWTVK